MRALLFPLGLSLLIVGSGCATERAVSASTDLARAIGVAIVEKSHFTETAASANANINNPHYRVLAALVQGVLMDIGLDGVQVQGSLQGQGSGPDIPLSPETLRKIVDLKMDKIRRRLQDLYKIDLELTPAVGDEISSRCQQITIGARLINLIINETVLPEVAKRILEIMGSEAKYDKLVIDAAGGEFTYDFK